MRPATIAAQERSVPLSSGWRLMSTPPNALNCVDQLHQRPTDWIDATVPGTVAHALRAAGRWSFDDPTDLDDRDWWFRATFDADDAGGDMQPELRFDGLATLAEVWVNGEHVLSSANMFQSHTIPIGSLRARDNEVAICFRSLSAALARRRPRPRWKTKLVKHQQLRWIRTTLLGRIPGWSPSPAPVGPWRGIQLVWRRPAAPREVDVKPSLDADGSGVVEFSCRVPLDSATVSGVLECAGRRVPLHVERVDEGMLISGVLRIPDVDPWWPHTHGTPALYACTATITVDDAVQTVHVGPLGFRRVEVHDSDGGFALRINGVDVFCRGACWTTADVVNPGNCAAESARTLARLADAGANMVRVGGTMVYQDEAFYRRCDALGLLVWQDFMFANMDYPEGDPAFVASVEREAQEQLRMFRRHACIAVYCGNSEAEQQAAMVGVPREIWRNPLFESSLPTLCARWHADVPYVPSTPSGGAMPFHVGTGLAHYYGVGAYLRPLSDVRRAGVRFTPECLAFSNVPSPEMVESVFSGGTPAPHDPRWKSRVPRDTGAGWDFEDVRDHYMRERFGVDPVRLRSSDPRRYLELGRVTTAEVMSAVVAEWRRGGSACGGALVWFLRDLRPGAGWGILDSDGAPKACYYALRRAWQPRTVLLTDEGLDGLHAHVANERDEPLDATLRLTLLRDGRVVVAAGERRCHVPARSTVCVTADELLGGFHDTAYAYRFGPPQHDVAVATLSTGDGTIAESFHFPHAGEPTPRDATVRASVGAAATGEWCVRVITDRVLRGVHLDLPGFLPEDDYFDLAPGPGRLVRLRAVNEEKPPTAPSGYLSALDLRDPVRIGGST